MGYIFVCYNLKDQDWLERVKVQFEIRGRQGLLYIWDSRRIASGADSFEKLRTVLKESSVAILLISANFLKSEFILSEQTATILQELHRDQGLHVIPLYVKSCHYQRLDWLTGIPVYPHDGKALAEKEGWKAVRELDDFAQDMLKLVGTLAGTPWNTHDENNCNLERNKLNGNFDVFLCHNSADKQAVKKIGEDLKARGIRPWLDEWELPPGLIRQKELEKQISNIHAAAVFVGINEIGPWQYMELCGFLQKSVKHGCPVIPVILPNCDQPKLPIFLGSMTWVDFRITDPDPLERLIWGIRGSSVSIRPS